MVDVGWLVLSGLRYDWLCGPGFFSHPGFFSICPLQVREVEIHLRMPSQRQLPLGAHHDFASTGREPHPPNPPVEEPSTGGGALEAGRLLRFGQKVGTQAGAPATMFQW